MASKKRSGEPTERASARAKARERLSQPSSGQPTTGSWMATHPVAKAFVEEWLSMLRSEETDWSVRRVHRELREEHGFPFGRDAFVSWIEKHHFKDMDLVRRTSR